MARVEYVANFPIRTGLREIAKVYKGEFRLTRNQHFDLSGVHDNDLENIRGLIKEHKLDNVQFSGLRFSSNIYVTFLTCGLAMAESERYLPKLVIKLRKLFRRKWVKTGEHCSTYNQLPE